MDVMMVRIHMIFSPHLELNWLQEETFGPVVGIQRVTQS